MTACHHLVIDSPVGPLRLRTRGDALAAIEFGADEGVVTPAGSRPDPGPFTDVVAQLAAYFAGERQTFDLPLDPVGTPFQLRVWRLLREIPYARTRSYGELARDLGAPGLSRAVGAANGRNPLSIVVPCHRVIGSDGSLTGYAGGTERKRWLLGLERRVAGSQAVLPGLA